MLLWHVPVSLIGLASDASTSIDQVDSFTTTAEEPYDSLHGNLRCEPTTGTGPPVVFSSIHREVVEIVGRSTFQPNANVGFFAFRPAYFFISELTLHGWQRLGSWHSGSDGKNMGRTLDSTGVFCITKLRFARRGRWATSEAQARPIWVTLFRHILVTTRLWLGIFHPLRAQRVAFGRRKLRLSS